MPTETTIPAATPAPETSLREKLTGAVDNHFAPKNDAPDPEPAPAPSPSPSPSPAKATEANPATAPAPTAAAATPAKASEAAPKEPKGIKELREAYDRQVAKANELAADRDASAKEKASAFAKASDLETRLAARESEIEKDYKPRMAKLEKAEKELQQYQDALRVRDYRATPEFHERFEKPIADTQAEVSEMMAQMTVNDGSGNVRPATLQDFNSVLASQSLNEAAEKSDALFGPRLSQIVMQFVTRQASQVRTRNEAIKTSNLKALEWEQTNQARAAQQRESFKNQLLAKSEEHLKGYRSDDPEEAQALQQGLREADEIMGIDHTTPLETVVEKAARSRAALPSLRVAEKRNAKLLSENAALKEQLKAFQKSEPTVETRNGTTIEHPVSLRSRLEADMDRFAARR